MYKYATCELSRRGERKGNRRGAKSEDILLNHFYAHDSKHEVIKSQCLLAKVQGKIIRC